MKKTLLSILLIIAVVYIVQWMTEQPANDVSVLEQIAREDMNRFQTSGDVHKP